MGNNTAAVNVAKGKSSEDKNIVLLTDGNRALLKPVSVALIEEVTNSIKPPEIPKWYNKDYERDEPNPNDPEYLRALGDYERAQGVATMDALVMFGVELIDGLPEDESWFKKLSWLAKRGSVDLSSYDLDDQIDREFVYKRYVAVGADLYNKLAGLSGVTKEEVEKAEATFQDS